MRVRLRKISVQPSLTRSSSTGWPVTIALKFSRRSRCQPGCSDCAHSRIGRFVAAQIDRRRRALEDVELLGVFADERHALDGGRTGADDGDAFVGELRQSAAVIAAGVVVVPAAGVERVTLEIFDARNRPAASAGSTDPSPSRRSAPSSRRCGRSSTSQRAVASSQRKPGHLRLETGVVVQIVVARDAL